MLNMKEKPYYGFPLSYILLRLLFILVILLVLFTLTLINISPYLVFLMSICIIPACIFYGVIHFKKHFIKNRMKLLKKFIKLANLKGNEMVLDLGTGSGFLAIGFAKQLKNGKSFGLDKFSFKNENLKTRIIINIKINFIGIALKNAKTNAKIENVENKCKFIQVDITNPLNFVNEYFNIIVSSQFFYCTPKKKRFAVFQEIDRVLKKGGNFLIFGYHEPSKILLRILYNFYLGFIENLTSHCSEMQRSILQELKEKEFKIVKQVPIKRFINFFQIIFSIK